MGSTDSVPDGDNFFNANTEIQQLMSYLKENCGISAAWLIQQMTELKQFNTAKRWPLPIEKSAPTYWIYNYHQSVFLSSYINKYLERNRNQFLLQN